jgi:hypothetical protein
MKRLNLLNNDAWPLGGRRILQGPQASSMIVSRSAASNKEGVAAEFHDGVLLLKCE